MYEAAYNTINERIGQVANANRNVTAQFQPSKIIFINDKEERKSDGSPDQQFVSAIHCSYAVKRLGSDTGTSVHLYFTQLADKLNYRVVFSNKTVFAGSTYIASKNLADWVDVVLENFKAYAYVIARFMNVGR
jgi:hypothetical protein